MTKKKAKKMHVKSQPKKWLKRILLWTPDNPNRGPRYLLLGLGLLAFIWTTSLLYLKLTPSKYRSEWTLVLPGKGAGANVNLVDIGQTSTSAASPYSNSATSPKANYKEFAMSNAVRLAAAKSLEMTSVQFGKPRIKLVDQTSLLYFSIEGDSPEQAQRKAKAIHQALLNLLDSLRQDEVNQQEGSALKALESYRRKLNDASAQLLAFQSDSSLVSMTQFNEVVMSIEQLRREKSQSVAQLKEVEGKSKQLQRNLNLTPQQAADSLVLQNDKVFQENIIEFTRAQQTLLKSQAKWGRNHPEVRKAVAEYQVADQGIKVRLKRLVNVKTPQESTLLTLQSDITRNKLMQDLIDFDVLKKGLKNKVETLDSITQQLIAERNQLTIPASRLDELIRNHQVAEAIFTSALARTDTSKSDVFVSYPLVQLLDAPTLPERPSSPSKLFVLLGASASTLLTITGLILLWIRKPYIHRILQSE